jgi:hypothetical protein
MTLTGRVCVCLNVTCGGYLKATFFLFSAFALCKQFACHSIDVLGDAYAFQILVIHFSSMHRKILIIFCYVTDCREQVL